MMIVKSTWLEKSMMAFGRVSRRDRQSKYSSYPRQATKTAAPLHPPNQTIAAQGIPNPKKCRGNLFQPSNAPLGIILEILHVGHVATVLTTSSNARVMVS